MCDANKSSTVRRLVMRVVLTMLILLTLMGAYRIGEFNGRLAGFDSAGRFWALEHEINIIGKSPDEVIASFELPRNVSRRNDGTIDEIIFFGPARHSIAVQFGMDGKATAANDQMGG